MKSNSAMIKKEAEIFGLLFLGDGATISRCTLLNILASEKNIPVAVLGIVYCRGHLADGNKKRRNINLKSIFESYEINRTSQKVLGS